MSNLPISFGKSDIVTNSTLQFTYSFEKILTIERAVHVLPFVQDYKMKALKIDLEGKTSNPSISVSINSNTRLFTLNTCYVTDLYPHEKGATTGISFVIEGYSIENVNKERVMIYLPLKEGTVMNNVFNPLERALLDKDMNTKIENGLDLNEYIPSTSLDTDCFTYYKHSDNNDTVFHILYFTTSTLICTNAFASTIPKNANPYTSPAMVMNYKSNSFPKHHTSMTNEFEDNIYIDCVPVDFLEQNKKNYMHIDRKYTKKFSHFLHYIAYFIILTLIVYAIYYIYIYATGFKLSEIKLSDIKLALSPK